MYHNRMVSSVRSVGDLLREWRQRRRLSQLELAGEAEVSARHLSFVETGRASPSREMVMHLAERLEIPLRERNALLMAAGFAPVYPERPLDSPTLWPARQAIERVLAAQEPYPALAVDRHWTLLTANAAVSVLLEGMGAELLRPPVNVLRLSLHPAGLASRIANLRQWRAHILARLRQQIEVTTDPVLSELLNEFRAYPLPDGAANATVPPEEFGGIALPLQLRTASGILSLISTTTIFGTPIDITVSEIGVESFFPADAATETALRQWAERRVSQGTANSA